MPRFFCDDITETNAVITGEDAKHIGKALRMQTGGELTLCDKKSTDYDCVITEIGEDIKLDVIKKYPNQSEPPVKITLYQCLPKSDKLEFIIQKAVELGASKIVPVQSEFCIMKIKDDFAKKLARLNKIAFEAAKQSGRGIIPEVMPPISFKSAVKTAVGGILFYEGGGERIADLVGKTDEISLFVGSEGGFSETEVNFALENGIKTATLGKLILRCETAPIVGISLVLHEYGVM